MACQAFQETLNEEALSWFLNLLACFIDKFTQLTDKFLIALSSAQVFIITPYLFSRLSSLRAKATVILSPNGSLPQPNATTLNTPLFRQPLARGLPHGNQQVSIPKI